MYQNFTYFPTSSYPYQQPNQQHHQAYQNSYNNNQFYGQQPSYNSYQSYMASPAQYGSPGTFSGRKAMQPPGGTSSISFSDGSNYSPYAPKYASMNSYQQQAPNSYGSSGYGAASGGYPNADLSSQLNLQPAQRRPPSSGRRAGQSYNNSFSSDQSASSYGMPGGGSGYGMQYGGGQQTSYGQQAGTSYGQSAGNTAYGGGAAYGDAGYQGTAYGAGASFSSPNRSQYSSSILQGQPSYGASAASSYNAAGGVAGAYNSYQQAGSDPYNSTSNYQSASGYGASMGPGSGAYSRPPAPAVSTSFVPGQKGQFCGKVIMQPPGGKQSINIFG